MTRIGAILAEGWWFYLTSNKAKTEMSKPRTAICSLCQHKDKVLNSCNACGCFLPAKTRVWRTQSAHSDTGDMAGFIHVRTKLIQFMDTDDEQLQELTAEEMGYTDIIVKRQ